MLGRVDLLALNGLSRRHGWKPAAFLVILVVAAFLVEREKAVEPDHGAGGAELRGALGAPRVDVDGGSLQLGRGHLARDQPFPDELIEPRLIAIEEARDIAGQPSEICRADG